MNIPDYTPHPTSQPDALPPRKRRRWPVRLLGLAFCISLLVNLGTCSVGHSGLGYAEFPNLDEELAYGDGSEMAGKAIIISFDGPILRQESGGLFGSGLDPVSQALMEIQAATVDEGVQGILLQLNTPGGGVTASDELYHALKTFKEAREGRKVVVLVKDLCASGGYYMAMAADRIVAQPTAVVGSVGVMISSMNLHQLAQKLGIEDVTLASAENKYASPLAPVEAEHQEILQKVVDRMYERFSGLVLDNRPFDAAHAEEHQLLDGRILSMPEALEFGLVDEQGYAEDAREALEILVGAALDFYTYSLPGGPFGALLAADRPAPRLDLGLKLPTGTRFLYLWQP